VAAAGLGPWRLETAASIPVGSRNPCGGPRERRGGLRPERRRGHPRLRAVVATTAGGSMSTFFDHVSSTTEHELDAPPLHGRLEDVHAPDRVGHACSDGSIEHGSY